MAVLEKLKRLISGILDGLSPWAYVVVLVQNGFSFWTVKFSILVGQMQY